MSNPMSKSTTKRIKYESEEIEEEVVAYIFPLPVKRVLGWHEGFYYNALAIRAKKIKITPKKIKITPNKNKK